jgi:NADP-dependent alcohol dehydrogenase
VLDATKFIAVAALWKDGDPWDIVEKSAEVKDALPIGCVLTLPATGSEVNGNSVISRRSRGQKLAFSSQKVMPVFSLLDPATTLSLSWRQTANGIVDAFVHVMEQYLTYDVDTRLQDRQAEAILSTLVEVAPLLKVNPADLNARATLMWAASNALNNLINCGTVQDWSTHVIGHELTALHGLDHAQTLAIVLPAVMRHQKAKKGQKIAQFGQRVFGINGATHDETVERTIAATVAFFEETGIPTRLGSWELTVEQCLPAAAAIGARGWKIGEHQDIGENEVAAILRLCA